MKKGTELLMALSIIPSIGFAAWYAWDNRDNENGVEVAQTALPIITNNQIGTHTVEFDSAKNVTISLTEQGEQVTLNATLYTRKGCEDYIKTLFAPDAVSVRPAFSGASVGAAPKTPGNLLNSTNRMNACMGPILKDGQVSVSFTYEATQAQQL